VSEQKITDSTTQKKSITEVMLQGKPLLLINDSTTNSGATSASASFVRSCVKTLSGEQGPDWKLLKFIEIDSLKTAKAYEKYVQDLDIGQIKNAYADIYDTLLYPNGKIIVWGLKISSYEACPYFEGKTIYLTTISNEGIFKATAAILEISSGGDAPAFGYDWGQCTIGNDLRIACIDSSLIGESEDQYESVEITPGKTSYEITSDGVIKKLEHQEGSVIKQRRKISVEN
jgi:hypothetical protein